MKQKDPCFLNSIYQENLNHMDNEVKIKLVAIAKNQSAYLPEWIFHHLFFGINAIDIYINRTTDNSMDMVKKIQKHYPQVKCFSADWVDLLRENLSSKLQFIIYAKAFFETQQENEFTHILFLDIDEFWTPRDFQTKLPEFILAISEHATVSFPWLNLVGDDQPFTLLADKVTGQWRRAVKSVLNLENNIKYIAPHLPFFDQSMDLSQCKLADGSTFISDEKNPVVLHSTLVDQDHIAFIIHRLIGSEEEYVWSLYEHHFSENFVFKDNRYGFVRSYDNETAIHFPNQAFNKYKEQREIFFQKIAITDELHEAQKSVIETFNKAVEIINTVQPDKSQIMRRIFQGVTKQKVQNALQEYFKKVDLIKKP